MTPKDCQNPPTPPVIVKGKRNDAALAEFIGEMEEHFPWYTGYQFVGITIQKKDNHWLLICRAMKAGTYYVCFAEARTVLGCYRNLYELTFKSKGHWKLDRFKNGS